MAKEKRRIRRRGFTNFVADRRSTSRTFFRTHFSLSSMSLRNSLGNFWPRKGQECGSGIICGGSASCKKGVRRMRRKYEGERRRFFSLTEDAGDGGRAASPSSSSSFFRSHHHPNSDRVRPRRLKESRVEERRVGGESLRSVGFRRGGGEKWEGDSSSSSSSSMASPLRVRALSLYRKPYLCTQAKGRGEALQNWGRNPRIHRH